MRDFVAFVRAGLPRQDLPPEQAQKVIEELAAELEDTYEALLASGLTEEEAWRGVQRHVPDWRALGRELRAAAPAREPWTLREPADVDGRRPSPWRRLVPRGLLGDLRSSLRLLVKDRGFTATTILTLALCLGAQAAIFTVVHAVLLRPLAVPDAERIVALGDVYPTITPNDILSNTVPAYFDRLEALTTLEEQALFASWFDTIVIDGVAQEVRGMRATPSLFRLLRVPPALGRAFTDAEGELGAEHAIILSHGLWQRLYGGDPAVIGREIQLGWTGRRYTIVGVMPRGFSFFDAGYDGHARTAGDTAQFWIPLAFTAAQKSDDARTRYGFYHVGRLRPDASVAQVRAQMDALNARTFQRFPQFELAELGMYTAVTPLHEALTRHVRRTLYLLWGGAAFVLLIGAINVANLALARSSVRAREMATRLALGAGRLRVARQLIVEGIVLAVAGGAAGVAVGAGILRALSASGLENMPNAAAIGIDLTVIAVIAAVSVLVGTLIGLVPAHAVNAGRLATALADGSRLGTIGRTAHLFRRSLVIAQLALSVVLLVGATLLLASFRNVLAVDAGFRVERVVTATIFPPPSRYANQPALVALSERVLAAVREQPGVVAAGLTSNIALSGHTSPSTVAAAGRDPLPNETLVLPSVVGVTPGYFETMGTPLVRGRLFTDGDRDGTQRVAIVDERLAARLWPGEDPIGRGLTRGDSPEYTVVGVVGDVRFESLTGETESVGTAYFPEAQAPPLGRLRWIAIKTAADPTAAMRQMQAALHAIDPSLPLSDVQTMVERRTRALTAQRMALGLAGLFGAAALLLSLVGIYGVLSYLVTQRTREIGIRLALGSTVRGIFRLVFAEGLLLIASGLAIGLIGAVALARVLQGQLFGIAPTDPLVLASVAGATGLVGVLASVWPARRATRVEPIEALGEP